MSKISNFNQLLIIPFAKNLQDSISLSKEYGTGFEFNEFAYPWILENKKECKELIKKYTSQKDMPAFKTSHGAFFDTYIFSDDKRIKKVSEYRMRQSLNIAKKLKCKAVIFTGNINHLLYRKYVGPKS